MGHEGATPAPGHVSLGQVATCAPGHVSVGQVAIEAKFCDCALLERAVIAIKLAIIKLIFIIVMIKTLIKAFVFYFYINSGG